MQSKYYTPKVEELHPGMEVEWYFPLDDPKPPNEEEWCKKMGVDVGTPYWGKVICDTNLSIIKDHLEKGIIRVKHLDKEDIESLGWVWDEDVDGVPAFDLNDFELLWKWGKLIELKTPIGVTIFIGTIRNKSELKRVMEMVGINNQ
jgi:hypothetical protein